MAFAAALATGSLPPQLLKLDLTACDIGDRGAEATAAAMFKAECKCRVSCPMNRIGFAGRSALLKAHEAQHGLALSHAISLNFNGIPWPAALSRAMSRAVRRMWEGRVWVSCEF